MENSLLTVFLYIQPIVPQNNLPFDETNKESYFAVDILKRAILFYI